MILVFHQYAGKCLFSYNVAHRMKVLTRLVSHTSGVLTIVVALGQNSCSCCALQSSCVSLGHGWRNEQVGKHL